MSLEEYFNNVDIYTGETFAEFCARRKISVDSALRGYELGKAIQQGVERRLAQAPAAPKPFYS